MGLQLIDDMWRDFDRLARMGALRTDLLLDPAAWVVGTYRIGRALRALPAPLRMPFLALHKPLELLMRAMTGVKLPGSAEIGGGLFLGHVGGIAVAERAHIGRDCNLSHGVALEPRDGGAPWLGDRVYVGPGARIRGNVRIGNDAAIGANTVVNADVPDGEVVGSVSARSLSARVPGRRRPALSDQLRAFLRGVLPRPTQLLLR